MVARWILVAGMLVVPAGLRGQDEPPMREALMGQVIERFVANTISQAALTPEQAQRFRGDVERSFTARRDRDQRERTLWRALEGQMRPGVAADADSVETLLDGLVELRAEEHRAFVAETQTFASYLTPVQRAQVAMAFERLRRNIEDVIRRRMQPGPPRRQGPGPEAGLPPA